MSAITPYPLRELPSKAILSLLLFLGLATLAYAIIMQNIVLAGIVICLPIAIFILGYGSLHPRFIYLLYAIYAFYFTTLSRYLRQTGFSVGLDILLAYISLSILLLYYYKKTDNQLSSPFNMLTLSYMVWVVFILLQLINPGTQAEGVTEGVRVWILRTFILYAIASILSNTPRMLQISLIVGGTFVFIAFLKLLYQKYVGFDLGEKYWLYAQEAARTHIIHSGIRYFSHFTDAGNFGACMGGMATLYSIIGFYTRNRRLTLFCLTIALMATIGMLMSGTRGALAIPVSGFILFCLICKSIRTFLVTVGIGLFVFSMLTFTEIGNSNQFIRRARTALHPTEDGSFNVRMENRKEIAQYLQHYPWGVGLNADIPKMWQQGELQVEGTLPPDSYFVSIWIQTGLPGLILYLTIYTLILLRCCYIVMFKVRNKELRLILSALTCATFGIMLSGYVGEAPGMPPTNFILAAMLAFVMNGSYIDKQLSQQETIRNNSKQITRECHE